MTCRRQVITRSRGMDGDIVIDISVPAIKDCMDVFGVTDSRACLLKVRRAFHEIANKQE